MGGVAQLAKALGHRVTGCDQAVYPPMSDQLRAAGIDFSEGFDAMPAEIGADLYIVGNVARRGLPIVEALLNQRLPMVSGPEWLKEAVLRHRPVVAVAGTHGKTTTASLVAHLLDALGLKPGFLIGGVPEQFGCSARLGAVGAPFVIEADEYDTAFFDKRSKFLHYPATIAVLNNLEYDHADIFPDLAAIQTQFHHWIRTLPSSGAVVLHAGVESLEAVLARGCYGEAIRVGAGTGFGWASTQPLVLDAQGQHLPTVAALPGPHNRDNLLVALAAVQALALRLPSPAPDALARAAAAAGLFGGVRRRMTEVAQCAGITLIDDFAHHPTAIAVTLAGVRERFPGRRVLAVVEPRSNTMKLGTLRAALAPSLQLADRVFGLSAGLGWDLAEALAAHPAAQVCSDIDSLSSAVLAEAVEGDVIILMSNGSFGGLQDRLAQALAAAPAAPAAAAGQGQ